MSTGFESTTVSPSRGGLAQHTGFLLARVGRAVTRQYRSTLTPIGLKPRETTALLALRDEGAMSQQALGAALDMDASNVVVLLNDLEGGGLILRRRDPEDRRRHLVEISKRGSKLICEVERASMRIEDEFFAELDPDERATLHDLLARLAQGTDVSAKADEEGC
ncbi:MAG: MarR family transcriptional regulator [Solirubrobacterales bacterium]|nr:MarR family transcriptional regulator [Solirubrobacterales bacterium]